MTDTSVTRTGRMAGCFFVTQRAVKKVKKSTNRIKRELTRAAHIVTENPNRSRRTPRFEILFSGLSRKFGFSPPLPNEFLFRISASHFDFLLHISANMPIANPEIVPAASRTGAAVRALPPKIHKTAMTSCIPLETTAPAVLSPTADILFPAIRFNRNIVAAEEKVPAAENTKRQEKKVPPTIPCAIILTSASRI